MSQGVTIFLLSFSIFYTSQGVVVCVVARCVDEMLEDFLPCIFFPVGTQR